MAPPTVRMHSASGPSHVGPNMGTGRACRCENANGVATNPQPDQIPDGSTDLKAHTNVLASERANGSHAKGRKRQKRDPAHGPASTQRREPGNTISSKKRPPGAQPVTRTTLRCCVVPRRRTSSRKSPSSSQSPAGARSKSRTTGPFCSSIAYL